MWIVFKTSKKSSPISLRKDTVLEVVDGDGDMTEVSKYAENETNTYVRFTGIFFSVMIIRGR